MAWRFELFSISRDEIQNRIWSVVAEVLAIDTSNMSVDVSVTNTLAPDSLDQVRLYMTLEDEFGRTIPEQELERIETIRDIIDYVEKAYLIS